MYQPSEKLLDKWSEGTFEHQVEKPDDVLNGRAVTIRGLKAWLAGFPALSHFPFSFCLLHWKWKLDGGLGTPQGFTLEMEVGWWVRYSPRVYTENGSWMVG